MKLYLMITPDDLELPVAVADSPGELARITGFKRSTIEATISHSLKPESIPHQKHFRFRRVEVEDDNYGEIR